MKAYTLDFTRTSELRTTIIAASEEEYKKIKSKLENHFETFFSNELVFLTDIALEIETQNVVISDQKLLDDEAV